MRECHDYCRGAGTWVGYRPRLRQICGLTGMCPSHYQALHLEKPKRALKQTVRALLTLMLASSFEQILQFHFVGGLGDKFKRSAA